VAKAEVVQKRGGVGEGRISGRLERGWASKKAFSLAKGVTKRGGRKKRRP